MKKQKDFTNVVKKVTDRIKNYGDFRSGKWHIYFEGAATFRHIRMYNDDEPYAHCYGFCMELDEAPNINQTGTLTYCSQDFADDEVGMNIVNTFKAALPNFTFEDEKY